jgi:hypothetical protein
MPLSEMAGTKGGFITLDGEELQIRGRILENYEEISARMMQKSKAPIDAIRELINKYEGEDNNLHAIVTSCFLAIKSWNHHSLGEILNYVGNTWDGRLLAIWLAVRDNDPSKWTFSKVKTVVCREYQRLIYQESAEKAEEWISSIESEIDRVSREGDETGN